jgi:uncharacterized protein with GYD domain
MKLTDQGIKDIRNFPQRFEAGTKLIEAAGGKITSFYAVMGEYDYVVVTEGPSAETAMGVLLALGGAGNVRTTTQRAFTAEEFARIIQKLP